MLAYFNDVFKPLVVSVIHDIPPNESSYITSAVAASIDSKFLSDSRLKPLLNSNLLCSGSERACRQHCGQLHILFPMSPTFRRCSPGK